VQLNEVVNFRCEIETSPDGKFVSEPLFLDVGLYHLEANEKLIKDNKLIPKESETLDSELLKVVSQKRFRLNNPVKGLFDYVQVRFDQAHFSVVDLTVHTVLIGKLF